jgi:hypothetical protein
MNKAAEKAALGTNLQGVQDSLNTFSSFVLTTLGSMSSVAPLSSSHVVTSAEATADAVELQPGVASFTNYIIQIYRSGVCLTGFDTTIDVGKITISTNGSEYDVTEGDIINSIIYPAPDL